MSRFIDSIITRHLAPTPAVQPRLRGRFEGLDPGTGQLAAEDGVESTEALGEKPAFGSTGKDTEMLSGEDVHLHSPADQLHFTPDSPGVNSENKDSLLFYGTFETAVGKAADNEETPANGISRTAPSTSHADQGSAERSDKMGPMESHSILADPASGETTKGSDFHSSRLGQPPVEEDDLSINRSSLIPDLDIAHKTGPPLSRMKQDISRKKQSWEAYDNSLTGEINERYIPGFIPSFEPGLNAPEQPVIKVSIGRINIRAEVKKAVPVLRKKQSVSKPAMSLEDYLKNQNNPKR